MVTTQRMVTRQANARTTKTKDVYHAMRTVMSAMKESVLPFSNNKMTMDRWHPDNILPFFSTDEPWTWLKSHSDKKVLRHT